MARARCVNSAPTGIRHRQSFEVTELAEWEHCWEAAPCWAHEAADRERAIHYRLQGAWVGNPHHIPETICDHAADPRRNYNRRNNLSEVSRPWVCRVNLLQIVHCRVPFQLHFRSVEQTFVAPPSSYRTEGGGPAQNRPRALSMTRLRRISGARAQFLRRHSRARDKRRSGNDVVCSFDMWHERIEDLQVSPI